ncbi:MAG: hypothetical protein MJ093_09360 [Saccharofermentans sp.]|nr:hypothetical protein [Saccharofermentans sp.]
MDENKENKYFNLSDALSIIFKISAEQVDIPEDTNKKIQDQIKKLYGNLN